MTEGGHRRPGAAALASGIAKGLAWRGFGLALRVLRLGYAAFGKVRDVDVLVYKVDRLGDWLLAEPAIARIVEATRSRGGTVAVWAGKESAALRAWRPPDFRVEEFALDPRGPSAKLRRACAAVRLLAAYRARTLICLRHTPEPVRDFVLARADAGAVHALSRCFAPGPGSGLPHEIERHHAILLGAGMAPADARQLLPRCARRDTARSSRVVLAPFSSAPIKDWRDEGWLEVIAGLAGRGLQFDIWVGPDQLGRAASLARRAAARAAGERVNVKSGALAELAEAVGSAHLVLSVDTFAAHLGVVLDAPMVCLIGGGQYGDFGPWQNSARQRWVAHPLPCYGCNWRCRLARVECLEDITPESVLGEVASVLMSGSG